MITQLQSFIHDAESDQETKEKKRSQLKVEKEQLIALIHQQPDSLYYREN